MKHSMMRVAVAATLGFVALAANAGQIGVNVGSTLAAEYLVNAAVVNQPTITYQTASLINDGATVQVHVRFSAGAVATLPTITATATNYTDIGLFLNGSPVAVANYTITAATIDADKAGYYFTLTAVAGKGGIPAGAIVNITQGTTALTTLAAGLSAGGTVAATVGYSTQPGDFSPAMTFVEAPSTAVVLTSAVSLSQKNVNSNAIKAGFFTAAETKKVDAVNASLKKFDVASLAAGASLATINLGATVVTQDLTLKRPNGSAPTAALGDFTTFDLSATGDFSGIVDPANAANGNVSLSPNQDCSAGVAGVVATDKKSVKFAGVAAATANANQFLCYTVSTKSAIPYGVQFAFGADAVASSATIVGGALTGGNVYNLVSNGASVIVPSFIPPTGAVGTGYGAYLRVMNTGSIAADINVATYNSATGAVGTPVVVKAALASGGSVTLDTAVVSSQLGLTSGWTALLVTAATSKLAVQPLLLNPTGVITNLSAINGTANAPSN